MVPRSKYDFDFSGKMILVVEDNPISFKLIAVVLGQVNMDFVHAGNGKLAIEMCESNPDLDLVLMDIQLPGINGLQATREIKKFRPDLPVIAATANTFDEDKAACIEAGCSAYITKPLQFRKLFELMQIFLDSQK